MNMTTKIDGFKTYIVMAVLIGLVIAQSLIESFTLPVWVIPTLIGMGGMTIRHAMPGKP